MLGPYCQPLGCPCWAAGLLYSYIEMASMNDKSCYEDSTLTEVQANLKEHFAEIVGSLIYISITCRPDISCAVHDIVHV